MSSPKWVKRFKVDPGNEEGSSESREHSPTKYTTTNDPINPKVVAARRCTQTPKDVTFINQIMK